MEIEVSRRAFLGGILTLTAAASVPASALAPVPLIYGDGIHDDTGGLNALFRGEAVHFVSDNVTARNAGGTITLSGGSFLISDSLVLSTSTDMSRTTFIPTGELGRGKPVFVVNPEAEGARFRYTTIRSPGVQPWSGEGMMVARHLELRGSGMTAWTKRMPTWSP